MADKISVHITQAEDGLYAATVAEFPDVSVTGAKDLVELRRGLEIVLGNATERRIKLPDLVPGSVTSLGMPAEDGGENPTLVVGDA